MSKRTKFITMQKKEFDKLKKDYDLRIIKSEELYFLDSGHHFYSFIKIKLELDKDLDKNSLLIVHFYFKQKLLGSLDVENIPDCILQNTLYFGNDYLDIIHPFACLSYNRYHKTWSMRLILADKSIKLDISLFMEMSDLYLMLKNHCFTKVLRRTYRSSVSDNAKAVLYSYGMEHYMVGFKNFNDDVWQVINAESMSLECLANAVSLSTCLDVYMFNKKPKVHYT